ncbi:MAG TPA: nicotinate-nucleotide adenylyltransferase [Acidimicrobiales bacterium]|jgi:nicotinate-nucleotide adenylyltransferase
MSSAEMPVGGGGSRSPRIGLLGGTFDPPHLGHLAAAQAARDSLALDEVLLVVANHPWQKVPARVISPAEDRFALVRAAAEPIERVVASRLEIDRGGPSYTVETVEEVRGLAAAAGQADPELFVIVGDDLVASLPTWHRVDDLRRSVTLAVVARPHAASGARPAGWRYRTVQGRPVDASSSEVRERLGRGEPVDDLVPPAVLRCILRRGLYAVGG